MAIKAASAAQLVTLRSALAALDQNLQVVLQNGNSAAYLNTAQAAASDALVTAAKAAVDAVNSAA